MEILFNSIFSTLYYTMTLILLMSLHYNYTKINTVTIEKIYKMASDRADSVLESHRTSLLELIEDRNKALNKV